MNELKNGATRSAEADLNIKLVCSEIYGLDVSVHPLSGEQDLNFMVRDVSGEAYVLKISEPASDPDLLKLQNKVLHFLEAGRVGPLSGLHVPRIIPSRRGRKIENLQVRGTVHPVRLLTYLPGRPIARVRPHSSELLKELGGILGSIDLRLSQVSLADSARRNFMWDLRRGAEVIRENLSWIRETGKREIITRILETCLPILEERQHALRTGLIHNDANDYNIIVSSRAPGTLRVSGLIDFGDLVDSWIAAEPAIAATYLMMGKHDPVSAAADLIAGYDSCNPLTDEELAVVFPLACLRAGVSVCLSARRGQECPENKYLTISEEPAWKLLEQLVAIHPRLAEYRIRDACRREPCPRSSSLVSWLRSRAGSFHPPLPVNLEDSAQAVIDLGVDSMIPLAGGRSAEIDDPTAISPRVPDLGRWIQETLQRSRGTHLIGRYNEARLAGATTRFKGEYDLVPERKNIHLGIDIFLAPGTEVLAPLDGRVFSVSDNSEPLGYGPTVILAHHTDEGVEFFTLYGHLSRMRPKGIVPGLIVRGGDPIGYTGEETENGGWPPHLHFQLTADLLGHEKSFPGVAFPSQKEAWLSISPDPNLILGIPSEVLENGRPSSHEIMEYRKQHLGKSLSLSYRSPLQLVRGAGQYLYDEAGRQYLDGVNNVCHVGHSHPRVVRAVMEQASLLNTNTRYLHRNLVEYIEALLSHFPEPLDTCFLVCSGSEANELALRLARAYTAGREIIALDGAYHGNTQTLIDISSYKHSGPGGKGAPDWAHIVPLPDGYRGRFKGLDPESGEAWAGFVTAELESLASQGKKTAAFICEPLPGCGGQIILPDGYLENVYSAVRRHGGVNIADEVQTGFGRVGSHFWGFETQRVIPDIVTLGKPMGNGHPLAGVVTTSEIADAFANGMEYFNTFGGNPVSCAAGKAVLEVIETEQLQAHALETGNCLRERLDALREKHQLIGDVRGRGLFLGVELVLDQASLRPAAEHAGYVVNRMREKGILLSTDGPLHNVLKIKPPLPFSGSDADFLAETLDEILGELQSQGWE